MMGVVWRGYSQNVRIPDTNNIASNDLQCSNPLLKSLNFSVLLSNNLSFLEFLHYLLSLSLCFSLNVSINLLLD